MNLTSVDSKKIANESTKILTSSKYDNSIPFEAFITISREPIVNQEQQALPSKIENSKKPIEDSINQKITIINNSNKQQKDEDNSKKRQISTIGELLNQLGIFGRPSGTNKTPEASTLTSIFSRPTKKKIRGTTSRPFSLEFDDLPDIPDRNETSQRQEFDDEEEEEEQGSLGSIADLIPLALPILEDLSNPESESDLIEVLEAAIPIIQGLSDADGENGGTQELINMIVPVIKKIVGGKNGQGIDLSAIAAPLFNLLAPFIGPLLAPVIGPLIRTISNPSPEGSSLESLITAVLGPLTTPQEPSKMSPLSIVLAGTTAALLKELKLGQPGGSDLGALISAILTGVISGTSAGLSGGLSGGSSGDSSHGEHVGSHQAYNPYTTNIPSPVASSIVNFGYANRPSPGPPVHSPFFIHRPNYSASTVNIGSTIRPETPRPTIYNHHNYHQSTTPHPQKIPSPKPIINNPGSFPDASTDVQHEHVPNAVPAHTVNPLALIGDTIKDVLGAGGQIVTAFINAIVGIFGGSSQS
ncbi:uncharacterized protein LOC122856661 [Aphidius gifuensis]|uniref:uncharacterized protein LOC122856661 n=1 Tax=Aphidius gifuensis TaxID=684658 RepID=UPI001CDD71FE|nr:uncharacterized protein LOC122856661 [Aphidius gifuensis]